MDALISAVLGQLTKLLIQNSKRQWQLQSGVEEEVKKLESNLGEIHGLLEDAEEKQMKEKSIKHWLENLKETAYDVEDELDEWNTALLKLQNASFLKRKVFPFISCFSFRQLLWRRDFAVKIKKINKKIADIVEQKDSRLTGVKIKQHKIETVSFVDESKLHGREEEKKNIKSNLLSQDEEIGDHLKTISILGIGGIGKTALSQLVYNDDDVKAQFHEKLWVSVSNCFDLTTISKAILIALEKHDIGPLPLQTLLEKIHKKIQGKKVLLVLDDVWIDEVEEWEPLKKIFCSSPEGSRFLTLGGILQSKSSKEEWEHILENEIWKLEFAEKVFNPLFLSYCNLPPAIRPCLLYCAIFPKDFLIIKDVLIRYWMAQGYLESDENSELELTGEEYFKLLASRGFFQNFRNSVLENQVVACKMHAFIHEFLQFLTKDEFVLESINKSEKPTLSSSCKKTRHLRMVLGGETSFPKSIVGAKDLRSLVTSVHDVRGTQKLDINAEQGASSSIFETLWRQLQLTSKKDVLTNRDLCNLFNHSKRLRLLDLHADPLSGHGRLDKGIPKEIGKLIHLRYLNLSAIWNMKVLPETVSELYNLQCLEISCCIHLEKLPKAIGKLTNLRYLNLLCCPRLTCCPKGLAKLTSLRDASGIIVRADRNDSKEFSIGDLENLDRLTSLWIKLVGNTIDADEVKAAKFGSKTHLKELIIFGKDVPEDNITKALNLPAGVNVLFLKDADAMVDDAMNVLDDPDVTGAMKLRLFSLTSDIRAVVISNSYIFNSKTRS
ncbi:disease resistance protein RGA2-like [Durio zibethinus]|uniref:Disease resistance protein RGA2-like n=1 Tax=Durio zibethinus TaxID=66656 RepID=A0A6P6AXU4_DURZI|nr:disease resistance protein RGA2-like [Durio zibethinus]